MISRLRHQLQNICQVHRRFAQIAQPALLELIWLTIEGETVMARNHVKLVAVATPYDGSVMIPR